MSYVKRLVDNILDDYIQGMSVEELAVKYHQNPEDIEVLIESFEEEG